VLRLPGPCVIVLVGPSGAGKSTWAQANMPADSIVSSDRLRAMVGTGEHDLRASADAFEVLDLIVERRMKRRLTTVIDSLGMDADRRAKWLRDAARHNLPCFAIGFEVTPREAKARLQARGRVVPAAVLKQQFETWRDLRGRLVDEGFTSVAIDPGEVEIVQPQFVAAPAWARQQREQPVTLRFGLQIPSFTWPGGPTEVGPRLRDIAQAAEDVGFESIWVMDHFRQIPVVGPEWHDMFDSYTTLGFVAAATRRVKLGTMVTGVTYRNIAHLGKIVATLDVLSGGRAVCGIGAAWFRQEHLAYGWPFPSLSERYALLEDALRLLPLLWGPGAPAFEGARVNVPEAMCYPRPLQEHIPILVGGSGERRTLKLVAQYADACNLFGEADVIRHKVDVLHHHCDAMGRAYDEIDVTQLSSVLIVDDHRHADDAVAKLRPPNVNAQQWSTRLNAGTVDDHIGRYRGLADAGVDMAVLSLADLGDTMPVERFAPVIAAFAGGN
jgi:F420-dependent oxidoreductase-like protein